MTREKSLSVLNDLIALAIEYDRRGDVVLRDQTIRNIEDLPVSFRQIRIAKKKILGK